MPVPVHLSPNVCMLLLTIHFVHAGVAALSHTLAAALYCALGCITSHLLLYVPEAICKAWSTSSQQPGNCVLEVGAYLML